MVGSALELIYIGIMQILANVNLHDKELVE